MPKPVTVSVEVPQDRERVFDFLDVMAERPRKRRYFDASSRSLCTFFARRERGNQWNVAVTCVCSCTVCTSPALLLVPGLPWVKLMFSAYLFVTVFFAPFDWRRKPRGGRDR